MTGTDGQTMRRLATSALAAYGLPGARLRPLRGLSLRGVFRVDAPASPAQSSGPVRGAPRRRPAIPEAVVSVSWPRFVLRIHEDHEDPRALRSVLDWLVALRRDTDLGVPEPVAAHNGALLVTITTGDGSSPARYCELLRWLDGRVPGRAFSRRMLERLGAFTARLHQHALGFVPPPGFSRPLGDADAILRGDRRVAPRLRDSAAGVLTDRDLGMLEDVEAHLRDEYRRLPRQPSSFGLMHGDLHPRNLLFHRGRVCAIDFEGCASDFFLYDLASSLVEGTAGWELLETEAPALTARREALLRGYRSVRPLPEEDAAHLTTFMALRALSSLPWLADWAANRPDDGWTATVLRARLRFLSAHLHG